jgi:hypothetical protein
MGRVTEMMPRGFMGFRVPLKTPRWKELPVNECFRHGMPGIISET